jgi:hypothetical protein
MVEVVRSYVAVMMVDDEGWYWMAEVVEGYDYVVGWVEVGLMLPLAQQWLLHLLLLAKDVGDIL